MKDILKEFEYLIPKDIDLIFSGTKRPLCSRQAIVHILEKALDSNTKRVRKEYEEEIEDLKFEMREIDERRDL